jgi:hypothetical protein
VVVEAVEHLGRRALPVGGDHPGQLVQGASAPSGQGLHQRRRPQLALALHHRVDRALRVPQHLISHEGDAVAAGEDEDVGPLGLRGLGQIDHLGDVGQVV